MPPVHVEAGNACQGIQDARWSFENTKNHVARYSLHRGSSSAVNVPLRELSLVIMSHQDNRQDSQRSCVRSVLNENNYECEVS